MRSLIDDCMGLFFFMGALESRHETEFEGARSESRARRPPQTPSSGSALENRGAYVRLVQRFRMSVLLAIGIREMTGGSCLMSQLFH